MGFFAAAIILAGTIYVIHDLQRRALANAANDVHDLAIVLRAQTARYIQVMDTALQRLQARANDQQIRTSEQFVSFIGTQATSRFLSECLRESTHPNQIGLFDANGALIARSGATPLASFSIADRDYFIYLRDHPGNDLAVGAPAISRTTGNLVFFLARRMQAPDGTFLGVAVVTVHIDDLTTLYQSITRIPGGAVTMLRSDGMVIARYPGTANIGHKLTPRDDWQRQVANGGGTYRAIGSFALQPLIVAAEPLAEYPIVVDVTVTEASVLAQWHREVAYLVIAAVLLAAALITLFWTIGRAGGRLAAQNAALSLSVEALRDSEARLEQAQEIAAIGSWDLDARTDQVIGSRHLFRLLGLPDVGPVPWDLVNNRIVPEDRAAAAAWLAALRSGQPQSAATLRIALTDSKERIVRMDGRPVFDAKAAVTGVTGTTQDITERSAMQERLAQSQKIEAMGNLTGGMAHDFNNMLGIIMGNLDLLKDLLPRGSEEIELCEEALDGSERCADLIRRLLAFARRQPLAPERLDVNAVVADTVELLRRTLGADIVITLHTDAGLWPVVADPAQLQAALVNLANNARDAMPRGGRLDISTRNLTIVAPGASDMVDLAPGNYIVIGVSDNGSGIPKGVIGRIFEPFFTTKTLGGGTGMGLPMVYGYAKQSGGQVSAYSEPGRGTVFNVYLPADPSALVVSVDASACDAPMGGNEAILVVEDQPKLQELAMHQLAGLGYRVCSANDAAEALTLLATGQRVDLLFTDVVMPGSMDGIELAMQAVIARPNLLVLLTSGFPGNGNHCGLSGDLGFPLLSKPYTREQLAKAIRDALTPNCVQRVP